jgi:hypothetical protein
MTEEDFRETLRARIAAVGIEQGSSDTGAAIGERILDLVTKTVLPLAMEIQEQGGDPRVFLRAAARSLREAADTLDRHIARQASAGFRAPSANEP